MATAQDPGQPVNPEPNADGDKLPASLAALIDDLNLARTADGHEERNGTNGTHGADGDAKPGSREELDAGAQIKIRGRPGGVAVDFGTGEWDPLLKSLKERLNVGEGFFRGGRVVLDVGDRVLVEEQLRQVCRLLEAHAMTLSVVHATAERTLQAASEIGVAISLEEVEPQTPVAEPPAKPTQTVKPQPEPPMAAVKPSAPAADPYAPLEPMAARPVHFVHRGSLRSGQVLRKTESIVVIGDVNPGAHVISGGDIMVWGRLRGVAHAGADGNRRAVVTAIDFVPTQLRIANLTAIAPDKKQGRGLLFWKKEPERRPEIARVVDGRIVVEPWDEAKPNSLGVWRK
jgi:septum site-determining protein MinC